MGRTTTRLLLLLVAVVVLGLLVKLNCRGAIPDSMTDIANKDLLRIQIAAEPYLARHNRCPPSVKALDARLEGTDPWDTPYRLSCCPAGEVLVVSAGADLAFKTADDLTNYGGSEDHASAGGPWHSCPSAFPAG